MITIIDYQMGNLRSVQKAFEHVGVAATISADPHEIAAAEKLVLPGVGGFGEAIGELRRRDLVAPIQDFIASGRPLLGICLGLQLLFETGFEGGSHRGLGILPGEVVRFEGRGFGGPDGLKVPHMGWNRVRQVREHPLWDGIAQDDYFYFVHSYHVVPDDPSVIATTTDYGHPFVSSIAAANIMAMQFHPEKSQAAGLRILRNFAAMA